jgi:hypothetical protein
MIDTEVMHAIFALMASQHQTLKAVAAIVDVIRKDASMEDQKMLHEALRAALDSIDGVIDTTRRVVDGASKNG